jgi:ABC-2 type transport system permease protein
MRLGLLKVFLRLSRTAFISWSIGVTALVAMLTAVYPSIRDIEALKDYMEALPDAFLVAAGQSGISTEELFLGGRYDFRAFVSVEYLSWFPVILAVYAVFYCGGLVAREVERGTLDMLLSHPLARWQFVLTKFTSFFLVVFGVASVSWLATVVAVPLVGAEANILYLGLAHLVAMLVVLSIGSYCVLLSCVFLNPGKALAASGGITLGLYFMNILAALSNSIGFLQKLSPFYYYESLPILYSGTVNWAGLVILVTMTVGGLALAMWLFQRKDLLN